MGSQRVGRAGQRLGGWLAVAVIVGGRPRTFAPPRWACLLLAVVAPLVATWYLGATLYLVFHDRLLASLINRQTDLQYAYEDRIASLRTQLDRETSRGLVDRHTLETTVHDLEERSALLESRAATIDRLLARSGKGGSEASPTDGSKVRPMAWRTPSVDPDTPAAETDAALDPQSIAAVTQTLAAVETRQESVLAALREPALRSVARLRTALIEVGLSKTVLAAANRSDDIGGPFVPLPTGAAGFEQNAALLQDALVQADRLGALASKVPLRKPLTGPLEVSSTFGPRMDPFYGRPAMHTGIDFRESYGDSVHVTAAGTVTIAGTEGGYGTMVEVDHGNGLTTRYAHLSRVNVVPNQKVAAGDIVGHVGSSGRATGPHLHYETRINGEPVDPTRFLRVGARLFE